MNEHFAERADRAVWSVGQGRPFALRNYRTGGKRVFDVVLSILLLPFVMPLLLIIALIVKRDGGPAYFTHTRVGRNGELFECLKLRSMVIDADAVLARRLKDCDASAHEWAETQKLSDDPRVTRLGRFLRKSSLDELPQIWNVLRGDMSLVGPRPVTPAELNRYGSKKRSYMAVRPGITGLWQVSGRNRTSYTRRVALDARYVANLSFLGDLRILARTFGEVMRRGGC